MSDKQTTNSVEVLHVNVGEVFRSKAPKMHKRIPRFVIRWIERTICQSTINDFLSRHSDKQGVDFAKALIEEECKGMTVRGLENLDPSKRYIFASNHPLGGMDGMALVAALGEKLNGRVLVVVNDLLMYLKPLRPVFLPINKHGSQSRESAERMNRELASDNHIIYFPAGLVSRRQKRKEITDLKWQKNFIVKAKAHQRDIVPVHFKALNSPFFYNFSYWRKRLGIKLNVDMLFLPRELFNKKEQTFEITIGQPIEISNFDDRKSPSEWAEWVRRKVYKLGEKAATPNDEIKPEHKQHIMKEEEIIAPVDKALVKAELTEERLLRKTHKAGNEIYVVTAHNAPNTMREIGRLREEAFRDSGGGTGLSSDIDHYDTCESPYYQLIVWNPDAEEILGGYRFFFGNEVELDEQGQPRLATTHMYNFSPLFMQKYMPHVLELGRSFVTLGYQSSKAGAKALFALDNLWDGLGALAALRLDMHYYFGKVTMYEAYPAQAKAMILSYWKKYFPDAEGLIQSIEPLEFNLSEADSNAIFCHNDLKEDYKALNIEVRKLGVNVPPLVSAYTNLSDTMKFFGTAINHEFGGVEESAIMVTINDMKEEKKKRHIGTFVPNPKFRF